MSYLYEISLMKLIARLREAKQLKKRLNPHNCPLNWNTGRGSRLNMTRFRGMF